MNKNVLIILLLNIMFVKCYNIILNIGSTGLLIPYSLGALGYIKKNINTKNPQLIGTSGGAYCSVIYNYENDLSNHDEIWTDIFGLNKESKINLKNLHLFQKFTNERLNTFGAKKNVKEEDKTREKENKKIRIDRKNR